MDLEVATVCGVHDAAVDRVRQAAIAELSAGSLPLHELVSRLRAAGVLHGFDGLDEDELAEEVDDILLSTDEIWCTDDGLFASTAALLDGVCLTHRLTKSESHRGVLCVTPDLVGIDFDCVDGLDLLGGGQICCEFPGDDDDSLDTHGSYIGPEGWLSSTEENQLVVLRRSGHEVSLEVVTSPGSGEAELRALKESFDVSYTDGVAVEPVQLLMDALCRDATLFREPVIPLGELLERAGLEPDGAWWGPTGAGARPPGALRLERDATRRAAKWDFDDCCERAFEEVRDAWGGHLSIKSSVISTRDASRALSHGLVAPAFAEYILGDDDEGSDALESFARSLSEATGPSAAGGLFLTAIEADTRGSIEVAEGALLAAVVADPNYEPALELLAGYEAYRGDAKQAVSLLRRARVAEDDDELAYLTRRIEPVNIGRNDPCHCGSGRKYKACCINGAAIPIAQRASWLYHKIMRNALGLPARRDVESMFLLAREDVGAEIAEALLPMFADLAAFDAEVLRAFLSARGTLLPDDEFDLASSWVGSSMGLWQIVDVSPGTSMSLRDSATGEIAFVIERAGSRNVAIGDFLFVRVLPVLSEHSLMGQPLMVTSARRASLLAMLDADPDIWDIAQWVVAAHAPPTLLNREGDNIVMCRANLLPTALSWDEVVAALDQRFGPQEEGTWTELVEIDGEDIVRSFLRGENETLVIETNSVERLERLYVVLREIGIDVEIIEDERLELEEAACRSRRPDAVTPGPSAPPSADMLNMVSDYMRKRENAWLDEKIPALGGLTPRQAADDPTRREDLIALLNEFKHSEQRNVDGGAAFDADSLKRQLNLD